MKGVAETVREPTDDEHDRLEAHLRRFSDAVATIGLTDCACLMLGDLVTVGFLATEVFDQTPGGDAGRTWA